MTHHVPPRNGRSMRKPLAFAFALTLVGIAAPALAYYWSKPKDDGFNSTLRGLGFRPIPLPSNLMTVGSLYYVDAGGRFFQTLCHAEQADLEGAVVESPSGKVVADELRSGRFATGVKINFDWLFDGDVDKNYQQVVHYSLTDTRVYEISLGSNRLVFAKLMSKPGCNDAVMEYIEAGGYVCQAQQVLQATAEFKIELDERSKIAIETKAKANINDLVKTAIEAQSDQHVVEKEGRLLAGSALNYGVSMNPTCLSPQHGRFARVLPQTRLDRIKNFVLFSIVESIWPGKEDAQARA